MCIKGTTTTHLRSRWGRVEPVEGWRGVVRNDTATASSNDWVVYGRSQ